MALHSDQRVVQPLTNVTSSNVSKYSSVKHPDAPFNADDDNYVILNRVISYYHETLKQSPDALAFLQKRGIDNSEVIEHFKLGFSNRTLGYRLPERNRKEGAALRGRLQQIGILKSTGHELFHGSIVVPIINNGIIQQVYGCKIAQKLRLSAHVHCYLPNDAQGLFNLEAVQISEELIFCPSVIEALTFWCAGYRNVTCPYGMEHSHE